jgi:RNA-directed DNA polymerase
LIANIPIDKRILKEWLKAGTLEGNVLTTNQSGTPQGGAISPTIFNITLNGIEEDIMQIKGTFPVRFADDITVYSDKIEKLEKVKEIIINFLKPRGLKLNEGKTKIADIKEGIDFLGYNIREYPDITRVGRKGKPNKQGILLIKPAKKSIKSFKEKIREIFKKNKKSSASVLIINLNKTIRG